MRSKIDPLFLLYYFIVNIWLWSQLWHPAAVLFYALPIFSMLVGIVVAFRKAGWRGPVLWICALFWAFMASADLVEGDGSRAFNFVQLGVSLLVAVHRLSLRPQPPSDA